MLLFRSIDYLPRPTLMGLTPAAAMLAVWALFEGTEPILAGRPVQPLWLAFVTYFSLTLAARLPGLLARGRVSRGARAALWAALVLYVAALVAGGFVADPRLLQLGWILGWLAYTALFVGTLLVFDAEDLALMPYRWAIDHPFGREAMWIVAVRLSVVALAATWAMTRGTLTEWVLFITLGRLFLFYVFEWITILFALTWRDKGS